MSSTINPNIPIAGTPVDSAPIRGNFAAAANDINALQAQDIVLGAEIAALQTQTSASFVTVDNNSSLLLNSRRLVAGTNMSFVDAGAGSTLTLNATDAETGTVTSVSVVPANGISGSVATPTTTPAITLALGAITPTSVNSIVLSGSATPTLAVTGTTAVSGTNTGDQTSITGNAGTATALQTARNIGGVSFNGTADIVPQTIQMVNDAADATSFLLFGNASGTVSQQPKTNTGLLYDATANNVTATTFTGALAGNANTSTTSTNIQTQNEASDTTCFPVFVTASGTQALPGKTNTGLGYNASTNNLTAATFTGALAGNASTASAVAVGGITGLGTGVATALAVNISTAGSPVVNGGVLGTPSSGVATNLTGTAAALNIGGNAATATALQNARTIGGVSFNGTANITVASATGGFTVSGGDLAVGANNITMTGSLGATGSRLTKGWFTDLQVTNAISGSITGNAATVTTNANLTGPITSVGNATSIASQTGTGTKFVVDTSPTLITPIIGVASATSINFGGTALSRYDEGAWTPIDTSGASLVFTNAAGFYTRVGNLVTATGQAAYPVTISAANAAIGGLPFSGGGTGKDGGQVLYSTITTVSYILMNAGAGPGTTASLFNSSGTQVQNSAMSGSTIYFQIIYHI